MERIHAERMLKLAAHLESLPPERFDFSVWASDHFDGAVDADPSCGTTACALGWAVALFGKECGVALVGDRWRWPAPAESKSDHAWWTDIAEAARRLFGVSEYEAELLFLPWGESAHSDDADPYKLRPLTDDSTAREVAAHLRAFVREHFDGSLAGAP